MTDAATAAEAPDAAALGRGDGASDLAERQLAVLGEVVTDISDRFGPEAVRSSMGNSELTLVCAKGTLMELLVFLRDEETTMFQTLIDLCGVDYLPRTPRFCVVYHLLSMERNLRIRVKVDLAEGEPIGSVTSLFPVADWFEREAFDMYGIPFEDHPDLRRLLTDYGFEGHPLRKDFPLTGHTEVRYDTLERRVVYEPVRLQQEYRQFDFLSPWEGYPVELPGDEKANQDEVEEESQA